MRLKNLVVLAALALIASVATGRADVKNVWVGVNGAT
jgi:hypothetical protein